MICLPAAALDGIREHARTSYPLECCGALVGRAGDEHLATRAVVRAVPLDNGWRDAPARRYLIPSATVRAVERDAEGDGLEVVGFYHSHPDHPPDPSAFDREHAWPWYTYIIIGARRDAVGPVRAWRLADDRSRFDEEELAILEEDA
jgi:proteasome lid subunit RPN8/RPN11